MQLRNMRVAIVLCLLGITAPVYALADEGIPDWLLTDVPGPDASVIWVDTVGDGQLLCTVYDPEVHETRFEIRDLIEGGTEVLDFNWDPAENGWPGYYLGVPCLAKTSPHGDMIAVLLQLATEPPGTEAIDGQGQPLVLLAWDQESNESTAVGVLNGNELPRIYFTTDSRYLIADSVLDCNPDLASYEACRHQPEPVVRLNDEQAWWRKPHGKPLLYYDNVTGVREIRQKLVDPPSVFIKCPYSNYVLLAKRWYPSYHDRYGRILFGDLGSHKITGSYHFDNPDCTWVDWVRPDAILLKSDEECVLANVDGSTSPAPQADWVIYWWFMDDSYLFSLDGGETIRYGLIDWEYFDLDVSIELPLPPNFLSDYTIEVYVPQVGLILHGRDNSEHPGRYMRMNVGPGRVPDAVWNDR